MITIEMIDELRKRVNVSYEDAKDALEKNNGDIVESIIYLEKNPTLNFTKEEDKDQSSTDYIKEVIRWCKNLFNKGNRNHLIIEKNENTVLNLSITLFVVILILAPYVTIPGIIITLFTGHKIVFNGEEIEKTNANEMLSKVEKSVNEIKEEFKK